MAITFLLYSFFINLIPCLRERPVYTEVILPNLLALIGKARGEVICDLACGQGWVARELARHGAQVVGLDLAPNLLTIARVSTD